MSIVIKLKQGMSLFVKHILPLSSTRVPHSAIYPLHWRLARSLSLNHLYGLYENLYLTKSAWFLLEFLLDPLIYFDMKDTSQIDHVNTIIDE